MASSVLARHCGRVLPVLTGWAALRGVQSQSMSVIAIVSEITKPVAPKASPSAFFVQPACFGISMAPCPIASLLIPFFGLVIKTILRENVLQVVASFMTSDVSCSESGSVRSAGSDAVNDEGARAVQGF